MSTQKTQRQPMSDKHKLIIIIGAIILAAVIAVSVTLGVMLQTPDRNPDDNDSSNNPSSSLPVRNGDFGLVSSEDTTYPKSATNWTSYGYKAPNGTSHDFEVIENTDKVVMGIVNVDEDEWNTAKEDLKLEDITLGNNPGQHSFLDEGEKHSNSNIYMIATKEATNAAIISDSVTVSATTSVKITVRINTSQITAGAATIMIQNHSSTPNAKEENRYAYKYNIPQQDGWQELTFYVFNRKTSTQYIRVSVGLGNVYTGEAADGANAEGILFVDDIALETVTANDYRLKADLAEEGDTTYKIIEKEEETTVPQQSKYLTLKELGTTEEKATNYATSQAYVDSTKTSTDAEGYSPFTDKDDFFKTEGEGDEAQQVASGFGIYKLVNDGTVKTPVALELYEKRNLSLNEDDFTVQDYNHISFWIRTVSKNDNALAYANILVQRQTADGEWEDLSNGNFTAKTEQNIKTDTNNGWNKYDIYLKPAKEPSVIRLVFALGSVKGYEGSDYAPEGELYVTTPYFETISSSAYTSASSGNASKKFDLAGSTASTSVTNGSFSSVSANTKQPTGWTPVYAGDNAIYRDGKGNIALDGLDYSKEAIAGSGVKNWRDEFTTAPENNYVDDDEGRILKLVSNQKSSFGYVSNEINVSAHTVYTFSVLAKAGKGGAVNALPYFYLLETGVDRDKAIVASVQNTYATVTVNDALFGHGDATTYKDTGWVRYYIVYVAVDEDTTVRLALFNGSMTDASKAAEAGSTIYYDKVTIQTLGTYSMVEDEENEDATEYIVKFSAASDFEDTAISECENVVELLELMNKTLDNNASTSINEPTAEEWTEMKKIPEPDDDDEDDDDTTPNEKTDVNLALLFSILSSVLLVAALAVVIVVKIYRQRKRNA